MRLRMAWLVALVLDSYVAALRQWLELEGQGGS
jgi:hypothetical protein